MQHSFKKTVVIALGGSIMYPEQIDVAFIKKFKRFIAKFLKKKVRFVVVVGGGKLCRLFQEAAAEIAPVTNEDKDWIGIHTTRLNAHLMRTVFRSVADPVVIDNRYKTDKLQYPVTFASGWRPGWSTDFIAAALALDFGAKEFVIAGKPSHVFNKDPQKHNGAKPFNELAWKEYRELITSRWVPGSHAPVDPVAARLAHERKLKAIVIDGRDLKNFDRLLSGENFKGTIIG